MTFIKKESQTKGLKKQFPIMCIIIIVSFPSSLEAMIQQNQHKHLKTLTPEINSQLSSTEVV